VPNPTTSPTYRIYVSQVDSCEIDMKNLEAIIENIDDLIENLTESIHG